MTEAPAGAAGETGGAGGLAVQVVRAFPDHYEALTLRLAPGACVQDALDAARAAGWAISDEECARLAIYGRLVAASAPLHAGDRLELLRPLAVDPKQRRRARAAPGRG